MPDICLTFLCPPAIEEKLIDMLLISSNKEIYTSTPTSAHGMATVNLDPLEQVMGRARATQIQLIVSQDKKSSLLLELHQQFSGAGLRYWITPVIDSGEIA